MASISIAPNRENAGRGSKIKRTSRIIAVPAMIDGKSTKPHGIDWGWHKLERAQARAGMNRGFRKYLDRAIQRQVQQVYHRNHPRQYQVAHLFLQGNASPEKYAFWLEQLE